MFAIRRVKIKAENRFLHNINTFKSRLKLNQSKKTQKER